MILQDKKFHKIRPRRGSKNEWIAQNPILLLGEIAIEYSNEGISDGNIRLKVGDGVTEWNNLPYILDTSVATSIIAGGIDSDNIISIKHGTTEEWEEADPVLELGEIVYDSTKGEVKIGDGIHRFSELRYVGQTWESNKIYDFGNYDKDEHI